MKHLLPLALFALVGTAATGCRTEETPTPDAADTTAMSGMDTANMTYAATLASAGESGVTGEVTFTQEPGGVRVVATVTGLTPGDHGFHVHSGMSCEAAPTPESDGKAVPAGAAGGHFAGTDSTHAAPDAAMRHDGDLGNLTADASGAATYDRLDPRLSLSGDRSIAGRAVIVHADKDDLTSQPSGKAGARLACGLVQPFTPGGALPGAMRTDTSAARGM